MCCCLFIYELPELRLIQHETNIANYEQNQSNSHISNYCDTIVPLLIMGWVMGMRYSRPTITVEETHRMNVGIHNELCHHYIERLIIIDS